MRPEHTLLDLYLEPLIVTNLNERVCFRAPTPTWPAHPGAAPGLRFSRSVCISQYEVLAG